MPTIALLEVLDRDGHVRHGLPVSAWPVRVGRSLDNDLVLDDPHAAAHHFTLDADDAGAFVRVGETLNGLWTGATHRVAGERIPVGSQALRLDVGDSHLRLRLAEHPLAPELPLRAPRSPWHSLWLPVGAGLLVLAVLLFEVWLETDPDNLARALGNSLLAALTAALGWCGAWSLVSKIFTRRSHFFWHARVLLLAVLAVQVLDAATNLLSFSLSWPWASDFAFVHRYAIGATMLYFHVLGVEPRRPQRMRAVATGIFLASIGLTLWFNRQASQRLGSELYMDHLFPPALRLARPVDTATFVKALAPLQATLDEQAKRRGSDASDSGSDD